MEGVIPSAEIVGNIDGMENLYLAVAMFLFCHYCLETSQDTFVGTSASNSYDSLTGHRRLVLAPPSLWKWHFHIRKIQVFIVIDTRGREVMAGNMLLEE